MAILGFYISTRLPRDHPSGRMLEFKTQFLTAIPKAYREAEYAPGFIRHANQIAWDDSKSEFDQDYGPWGKFAVPRNYDGPRELGARELSQSLSLWKDIESVLAYAYAGLHGEILRLSRKEFKLEFYSVAWWLADSDIPTWSEAVARLHRLLDDGPSPEAFSIASPYDANGNIYRVDPAKLRALRGGVSFALSLD